MVNKTMSFRAVSAELENTIERKITELDISRNVYLNSAVELYSGFDTKFIKALTGLAKDMGITPSELIQIRMSQWFGRIDAWMELEGCYPDLAIDTITQGDFEADYTMHKDRAAVEIEKMLIANGLNSELYGLPVDDRIKKIMIKYRQGNAWLQSDEYRKATEMSEHIKKILEDNKEWLKRPGENE